MSDKPRILLIENQQNQFEKIRKKLFPLYDVFPSLTEDDKYEDFIICVRIWVTNGYRDSRKQGAFDQIWNYILKNDINTLIIDYKLAGSFDGRTGLNLVNQIQGRSKQPDSNNPIPDDRIIFLSRTPKNSKEIGEDNRLLLDKFYWVEKGYAGMNILEENYFEKYIIRQLESLSKPEPQSPARSPELEKMLEELKSIELLERDFSRQFKKIKDPVPGSSEDTCIRELYALLFVKGESENEDIKDIFKRYGVR